MLVQGAINISEPFNMTANTGFIDLTDSDQGLGEIIIISIIINFLSVRLKKKD